MPCSHVGTNVGELRFDNFKIIAYTDDIDKIIS